MDITYLGHSSFRLKGKSAVAVTDPYTNESTGLKFPKHVEADVVTVSHEHADHNEVAAVEGSPYIIHGPGEYEVKGVGVVGFPTFHDADKGATRGKNTIYRFEIDGISIVHLGDLGHLLSSAEVDALDGVNVLLIPVSGGTTIDSSQAVAVIRDIEPQYVVPMHYSPEQLLQFMKDIGKEGVVPQSKLSLSKDKLPAEMQVVILE